jgi:tetratricopeptide (TPR) repeat protein
MWLRNIAMACAAAGLAFGAAMPSAEGKYIRLQIETVPVDRLVANLSKLADENPKDAQVRFNLARLHAMAFALKTDTAEIRQGQEENGAFFGYEPRHIPFAVQETKDEDKLKEGKVQLAKAIDRYREALKLDPNLLPAQLGYAWCLEQSGKRDEAIAEYRKTIELGWKKEKDLTHADFGWHSIVAEAAGYLKPLLDAEKDKDEIAELDQRIAKMERVSRPITPIAVPLGRGLIAKDLEASGARVRFDADGSGVAKEWSWITPQGAWLVYDPDGSGRVDSALQMFGNVTFWCFWDNGYAAVGSLDDNGDGQLTANELDHLALWHDANGNGRVDPGEVQPLTAYGIVAISCRYERDVADGESVLFSPTGVTFADGETRPTFDLVLRPATDTGQK